MADFKTVPLSGWDIAYAIGFENINKAIEHMNSVPEILSEYKLIKFMGRVFYTSVEAQYDTWAVIGTESGAKMGCLVKFKNIKRGQAACKKAPEDAKPEDILEYKEKDGTISKYVIDGAIDWAQLSHEVGVPLVFKLAWFAAQGNGDGFLLKVSTDEEAVEINADKIIMHPKDEAVFEDETDLLLFNEALKTGVKKHAIEEFEHIFATVDYTREGAHKADWLKISKGKHAYSVAIIEKKKNAALLKDLHLVTNLHPVLKKEAPHEEKTSTYEKLMDPSQYSDAVLIIVGMTENRKKPPSIPSDLKNLIPKGCKAGYAFNESLIIPHLLKGALAETFDGDVDKNFKMKSSRKIENINRVDYKRLVTMDFHNFPLHKPDVRPTVGLGGVSVFLEDAQIVYSLRNMTFTIPKGPLGLGLPVSMDLNQSMESRFDYKMNPKTKDTHKYATLGLSGPAEIFGNMTAHQEEDKKGFWSVVLQFIESLAANLLVMGLTMGLMKGGAWAWSKLSGEAAEAVEAEGVNPESESEKTSISGDDEAMEKHIEDFEEENKEMIERQQNKGEDPLSEEEENEVHKEKEDGKVNSKNHGRSMMYEIMKFTFFQTLITEGWQVYHNVKMAKLMKHRNDNFAQFVYKGIAPISWNNQDDNTKFEVKEAELTDGSFLVGLDIQFGHDES